MEVLSIERTVGQQSQSVHAHYSKTSMQNCNCYFASLDSVEAINWLIQDRISQ